MKEIVFVSNNKHKVEEVRDKLAATDGLAAFELKSLEDFAFNEEIPEPYETLKDNARAKAEHIFKRFGVNCFADDTGLEVEALDGGPGVYSARYAGEGCSFEDNVRKLLDEMEGKDNRKACFRTVICLFWEGKPHYFEGRVDGRIIRQPMGEDGFGYDPVFVPNGYFMSFAQMPLDEKNKISHRALALEQLLEYLSNILES